MDIAHVNGIELEYQVTGIGEPLLLISPILADGFDPLVAEAALEPYQLIRYHKRGWAGSTHPTAPVTVADHTADAAALLAHLGVARAHVAGHSSGAAVACQLALDHPEVVHSLVLLELSLLSGPNAQAFLQGAAPVLEAFGGGDHSGAVAMFLSAVSGMEWAQCHALLDDRIPEAVEHAVKDADTLFGVELPALIQWTFGAEQARAIHRPVLSVMGSATQPLWVEVAEFLRTQLPYVEDCVIDGTGHLLHIERAEPVAREMAAFLARNSLGA